MRVTFARKGGEPFEAELGKVLAEGGGGVIREGTRAASAESEARGLVVKQAGPEGQRFIELERDACEQLDHPGIVRYLGSSRADEGTLLAFERLGPNPLLLLSAAGTRPRFRDPGTTYYPLPAGRAIELAFDLLLGIEHLHAKGFVHADVKLSNVLVRTPSAGEGGSRLLHEVASGSFQGVLIDMGSVRATAWLEDLRRGDADLALIPPLTPLYAPPEVLFELSEVGGQKLFSPAMDMYAFGLVFYVLLTGRVPYSRLLTPDQLREAEAVFEVKLKEARGEVSPIERHAVEAIPLHDVAFERPAALGWPAFVAGAEHAIKRCIDPDPRRRCTASQARAIFEKELGIRSRPGSWPPPAGAISREWNQTLFQMRPASNRLTGDAPAGGMRVSELNGQVLVEEALPVHTATVIGGASISVYKDADSLVQFKTSDHLAQTGAGSPGGTPSRGIPRKLSHVPEAPKGLIYLADVLREFKAGRPLPVTPPVLVTRTGFSPRELARCMLYTLERAHGQFLVSDDGHARTKKQVTVGRGEDQDVVLADGAVSKKHLIIEWRDDGWWVKDLGSANGTTLDGENLEPNKPVKLRGSLSTIGVGPDSKLTFMQEEDLQQYLAKALELWAQAFARNRKPQTPGTRRRAAIPDAVAWPPPAKGASTENLPPQQAPPTKDASPVKSTTPPPSAGKTIPYSPNETEPTPWLPSQRTRRVDRSEPKKPAQAIPKEIPQDLEQQLRAHEGRRTSFYVVLEGARVEVVDTVGEVLELVREQPESILAIEVHRANEDTIPIFDRGAPR